jgi:hypothetical protein
MLPVASLVVSVMVIVSAVASSTYVAENPVPVTDAVAAAVVMLKAYVPALVFSVETAYDTSEFVAVPPVWNMRTTSA